LYLLTTKVKAIRLNWRSPQDVKPQGVVLCDQIRSLDWKARQQATLKEPAGQDFAREVLAKYLPLVTW
jgi:mRNA-degrading endonuclease toxin of MazEF toxin-antitoxin module